MVSLLLLLIPVGLIAAFGFTGYGFGTLGRIGPRQAGREVWFRCAAALLGAASVAVYTWGLLMLGLTVLDAEDQGPGSAPLPPCRAPGPWERTANVVGYTVDYLPLRFVCETKDGGSYGAADAVPGYVGPAALGFALAAVACAGAAAFGPADGTARSCANGV
ncbi:hypothetical protein AB0M87_20940 [Streptomyces sp. NPDC051320]|uniref:hypothetical protein n=1 Tax=Streptomyces sp. NPDC051320 TaxID=3154644 RepID=UPI0034184CCC